MKERANVPLAEFDIDQSAKDSPNDANGLFMKFSVGRINGSVQEESAAFLEENILPVLFNSLRDLVWEPEEDDRGHFRRMSFREFLIYALKAIDRYDDPF